MGYSLDTSDKETDEVLFSKKTGSQEIKNFSVEGDTTSQKKPQKTPNKSLLNLLNSVNPKILGRVHKVSGMMDMSAMISENKLSNISCRLIASKTVGL